MYSQRAQDMREGREPEIRKGKGSEGKGKKETIGRKAWSVEHFGGGGEGF